MTKGVATCLLIVSLGAIVCGAAYAPRWLNDDNEFLRAFISYELLEILGVVLAITLASASQIHLKFNEIEEQLGRDFLQARQELAISTYALIASFVASIALVMVKPILVHHNVGIALLNGLGLWILILNVLILFDITAGIFSIRPIRLSRYPPTAPPPSQAPPASPPGR